MSRPLDLLVTETAETDLAEIWATLVTEASEAIATRFVDAIEKTFQPLRHFPRSGPAREHIAPGLRVTFHGSYAAYYKVLPDALVIIRVIHGSRDIAALAENGGFA